MSWGQKRIGGEARVTRTPDDCLIIFKRDAHAIRTVFIDGDQSDIERYGCEFNLGELLFAGIIAKIGGAEATIFVGSRTDGTTTATWNAVFRGGSESIVAFGGGSDRGWTAAICRGARPGDRKGMTV